MNHQVLIKIPEELHRAMVAVQGSDAVSSLVSSQIFTISAEIAAAEAAKEQEALVLRHAKPGDLIRNQGIFLGRWNPRDELERSLGLEFNVFAAPEDLTDIAGRHVCLTYAETVLRVGNLKNWHGFDGRGYIGDIALYRALKTGTYKGEWVIPTADLLDGNDQFSGEKIQEDNLYRHKATGAFKGSYNQTRSRKSEKEYARWYWSCSEGEDPDYVFSVEFMEGKKEVADFCLKEKDKHSCRLVRFVEVK